ncbi:hypothetical protein CEQ90_10960 [Lewinellaceae bacterium SD302]|nr:hypothetical protein CEQ90_10960 [Lewinellaceae bacterium SD302]
MNYKLIYFLLALFVFSSCERKPARPEIAEVPEDFYPAQREVWQQPAFVLDAMGDLEEKVVADIGAGRGFLVPYVAPYCDRMIAIEIDPKLVDYLQDTLRPAILPTNQQMRLEARLTVPDQPGLNDAEADVVLLVNTLMYIDEPADYLKKLYPKIKPGGRLVIVDWKSQETAYGPPLEERIPLNKLHEMLAADGFKVSRSDDSTLDYQYLVVAEK